MSRMKFAAAIAGAMLMTVSTQPASANDGCLLDVFGLFSGQSSGRVTRRADPHLLEVHPHYGLYTPANRYRLQHYRYNSNFGRPYYREFYGDPWYEPYAYPGWSYTQRRRTWRR